MSVTSMSVTEWWSHRDRDLEVRSGFPPGRPEPGILPVSGGPVPVRLSKPCSLCPFVPWKQARGTGARTEREQRPAQLWSSGQNTASGHSHASQPAGRPACWTSCCFPPCALWELCCQCEPDRKVERRPHSCLPLLWCLWLCRDTQLRERSLVNQHSGTQACRLSRPPSL